MTPGSGAGPDLMDLASELVAIPSISHGEAGIADRVERELRACRGLAVTRVGDNVVARTELGRSRRVVVAGHLDTVPPAGNAVPRRDAGLLWGIGAADMKGSLAVMLRLAASIVDPPADVTWCFYAREEVDRAHSGLDELWRREPGLLAADAAVLCEPTDARVEAGCQGTMQVEVRLRGSRAHTARPFAGRNAIHRLASLLERVARWPPRRVRLGEVEYTEQLQAVRVHGGVAGNVVPDVATLALNHRFAPDRGARQALEALQELIGDLLEPEVGDELVLVDVAEGAPPSLDEPFLESLVERSGRPPRAKVGWTDVATFWSHGVPAVNFGAGDPLVAHHPDERVTEASLVAVHDALLEVLQKPCKQP